MCERQPLRAQSADNQDVANLADNNEQVNNEEAKGIDSTGQDLVAQDEENENDDADLASSLPLFRFRFVVRLVEFGEKLQWEENECFQRLRAEELQHDELVTDLMDQNAELQAEADSLRPPSLVKLATFSLRLKDNAEWESREAGSHAGWRDYVLLFYFKPTCEEEAQADSDVAFGEPVTVDHIITRDAKDNDFQKETVSHVVMGVNLGDDEVKLIYSDSALEFHYAAKQLRTRSNLVQSGLPARFDEKFSEERIRLSEPKSFAGRGVLILFFLNTVTAPPMDVAEKSLAQILEGYERPMVGLEAVLTDVWKSVFYRPTKKLLLVVFVDEFKLAGPKGTIKDYWALSRKTSLQFDATTIHARGRMNGGTAKRISTSQAGINVISNWLLPSFFQLHSAKPSSAVGAGESDTTDARLSIRCKAPQKEDSTKATKRFVDNQNQKLRKRLFGHCSRLQEAG
ncbi:Pacrg [Symbiodinium necroappetens]|uniref:Pacrg protein n=1 Tax=Symbiodinium necroappetens TaxID=1628268 RepID=A0A812J8A4_9DINO|nr:Pacrg [Symbiodinium necroappetens]